MTKRWSETQHIVARWFAGRGWPGALPVGNGRGGVDVTGVPDLAIEVKSAGGVEVTPWLRQAYGQRGHAEIAFVVWRPPKHGPSNVGRWPVLIELEDFTRLLRAAGYGDGDD